MPKAQVTFEAYCKLRSLKTSYPPKYTAKVACHVVIYCSSIDRYTIMNYKIFGQFLIVPPRWNDVFQVGTADPAVLISSKFVS